MIALSSELSRRAAEEAILAWRVSVGGQIITTLGTSIDPRADEVTLDGRRLHLKAQRTYLAFNKPRSVMCTKRDPEGRCTIWELDALKELKRSLNTVGRLDYDSEGLLLLSDDGDFINRLTHPRHEVWKVYSARVKGQPTQDDLMKLRKGVRLDDGMTLPAKVRRLDPGGANALLEIGIREGRNRQVRRMCDAIGFPVIALRRTQVGPVKIGRLKSGVARRLRADEVQKLLAEEGRGKNRRVKGEG